MSPSRPCLAAAMLRRIRRRSFPDGSWRAGHDETMSACKGPMWWELRFELAEHSGLRSTRLEITRAKWPGFDSRAGAHDRGFGAPGA